MDIRRLLLVNLHQSEKVLHLLEVDSFKKTAVQVDINAAIVQNSHCQVFIHAASISRKVMLIPAVQAQNAVQQFLVLDHLRDFPFQDTSGVIVPYFPTVNDMVPVQGSDQEPWQGRVIAFAPESDILSVAFLCSRLGKKQACGSEKVDV